MARGLFSFRRTSKQHEIRRIEEKQESMAAATEQWLGLLQDMQAAGQVDEERYQRYYQAYLRSKQEQKKVDLDLFNLRMNV